MLLGAGIAGTLLVTRVIFKNPTSKIYVIVITLLLYWEDEHGETP